MASRQLALQRLARQVIEERDRDAGLVLGDALMELGVDRLRTGRVRPVWFSVESGTFGTAVTPAARRVLTPDERNHLGTVRQQGASVRVPGRETLYGVDYYARNADPRSSWRARETDPWGSIFTMWLTFKRDVYRALVDAEILPPSIRFREIAWDNAMMFYPARSTVIPYASDLAWRMWLDRVPRGLKRSQRAYLFDVVRRDTAATQEVHFEDGR